MPRPEERRYDAGQRHPRPEEQALDVGAGGSRGGPKSGAGGARGARRRPEGRAAPRSGQRPAGPAVRASGDLARVEAQDRGAQPGAVREQEDVKLPKTFPGAEQEGERLAEGTGAGGIGSRRACEELIDQARVEVNGEIVMEQGLRVDPEKDEIKVDGLTVATPVVPVSSR